MIEYRGSQYPSRELIIPSTGYEITVSTESLMEALQNDDERCDPDIDQLAKDIDNTIAAYIPDELWEQSDELLVQWIEEHIYK